MKNPYRFNWFILISIFILFFDMKARASEQYQLSPQVINEFDGQIIYDSADSNIWLINGKTGNYRQLTVDANQNRSYSNPKFSPDGQKFAYCRWDVNSAQNTLFVSKVAKYEPVQVVTNILCNYDWSPDGSTIVYGKPVEADTSANPWHWINPSGIWIVDVNTLSTYELIPRTDANPLGLPRWSPNGEWVSYRRFNYFEGSGTFHTWRKADSKRFSPPATGNTDWYPDSKTLVFDEVNYVAREGMGLYLTSPDTNTNRRYVYSNSSYAAFDPKFSSDGEYIAFLRGVAIDIPFVLMLIKPSGSGLVSTGKRADYVLDWSPSGKQVLFAKTASASAQLLIYDRNFSTTTTLVNNAKYYGSADWGPLPPTYKILGHVTDPNGQRIEGVTISDGKGHTTVTDQFGAYRFDDLPAGTYTITAVKDPFTFAPAARTVTVPPDTDSQNFLGTDKPPIVFVHGWNGAGFITNCEQAVPDKYFEITDDLLRSKGYYVGYAYLLSAPCSTPHIQDNVTYLENAISLAKAATGQSKVILIAHSMGGIVSRAYIEDENKYADDVSELFTFGSPHLGISLRALGYWLNILSITEDVTSIPEFCQYQLGACDMSEFDMWIFNQRHHRQKNVIYHLITGDTPLLQRNTKGIAMAGLIPGSDDGLVSVASGIGLPDVADKWGNNDELHSLEFGDQYYFLRNGSLSHSYTECLEPVLGRKSRETCSAAVASTPVNTQSVDSSSATIRTPLQAGLVLPNQTITHSISVRNAPVLFVVKWLSGNLNVTLHDPAGQQIDPTYANNHPGLVYYQSNSLITVYSIAQPSSGPWDLVLKADNTVPAIGTAYTTYAAFNESTQFSVETDKQWYAPNSSMVITATITPLPVQADVTATLVYSGGTGTVKLVSVGNGVFQGLYMAPMVPGYGEVLVKATGLDGKSMAFEYGADTFVQFSSTKFQLTHTYQDSLGSPPFPFTTLFSDLRIGVGINAAANGLIELSADLVDANGKLITNVSRAQSVVAGENSITLPFNGKSIYASATDGPYYIKNVLLTDNESITIIADTEEQAYVTGFYDHRQFKLPVMYLPIIAR